MRGVNKVIIIGYLGQDPEIKYTAGGAAVVTISVATNEKWKDKASGEDKEHTEWHRIQAWGKLAEIIGQYCRKGGQVYICGKLKTHKWKDANDNDRYTTEIIASEMQLLGNRSDDTQQKEAGSATPPQQDFDDDIPF